MLNCRHDLHERAKIVQLQALSSEGNEKFKDLGPFDQMVLGRHTPHEEQGHLRLEGGREGGKSIFPLPMHTHNTPPWLTLLK